jgi:hypothetical protein
MNRRIYKSAERHVWIAWTCVALICVYVFFSMASAIERGLFPVVSRFDVLSIQHGDGTVKVAGTLIKDRGCEVVSLRAMSEAGSSLRVDYLDRPEGAPPYTRPIGASSWGPWRIHHGGARYVTLFAEHQCHPFWTIQTALAAFQVRPRYE